MTTKTTSNIKRVIEDVQDLTEESKNASCAAIQKGYDAMQDVGGKIAAGAERLKDSVGESISRYPWRSLAIATVIGLALGRLLRR